MQTLFYAFINNNKQSGVTIALDIKKIIQMHFSTNDYCREMFPKKQIYLHHTAGNASAINTAKYWQNNNSKVATSFVIAGNVKSTKEKDGDIIQCFSSKYWAYHLGLNSDTFRSMNIPYQKLDTISIGIEICNWGQLTRNVDGSFLNYVNSKVPSNEVTVLEDSFKGYQFYHKYTDAQIASLKDLLIYLCDTYNIDRSYHSDIFDISKRALSGENGIFTHNSVRKDKWDIYPCSRMIKMLSSL
jgi:N-acetyl-anhydromuramyl-L-alanine amidase AmpD